MSYHKTDLYGDPLRRRMRVRFGTIRYRHAHPVVDLGFALDGRTVATATSEGGVHVWKAATGKELLALDAGVELHCVAISARGSALAVSGSDGVIRVWDTAYGRELHALEGHEEEVFSLAISPDGRWLASGGGAREGRSQDRVVRVWRLEAGKTSKVLTGSRSAVREVAFSPDGWRLAAVGDKSVRVWRLDGWEREHTLDGHESKVLAVSFSPDGEVVVTGGADRTLRIWDLADGSCRRAVPLDFVVQAVDVSASGRVVAGDEGGGISVFALDGEPVRFQAFAAPVREVAWSPDGEVVLAASEGDRAVRLWHADGRPIVKGEGHFDAVVGVAFDGDVVVSVSADGELRRWERESGKPLSTASIGAEATCLAVGDATVVGTAAGVWVDGVHTACAGPTVSVAVHGGNVAAVGREGCWRSSSGTTEGGGLAVFIDEDGIQVAAPDGMRGCAGPDALPGDLAVFSLDGVLLACADGSRICMWDTREGVELPALDAGVADISALAIDRRRLHLAAGDTAGRIWHFDLETRDLVGIYEGHVGEVTALAFDASAHALVSGGADTTVLSWDIEG